MVVNLKFNIPPNANKIIKTLQHNGFKAYVVGGAVRDSILGRNVHDWDICTSATPDEMLRVFKNEKVIETGLQHGTITIVIDDEPYECTSFRIDGSYSDNRRPDNVTFTDDLIEDLKRRDFTINAMAYNDDEGLIDPFGGFKDIHYGLIRCVGSAKERFEEDALRILRAIRFSVQLNFSIKSETDYEIHRQYKSLKNIAIERINSEFCKMASSYYFYSVISKYINVFSVFIPEIYSMNKFNQCNPYHDFDVLSHTKYALEERERCDLITTLAIFFHDFGKPHCYQCDTDGTKHFKGHAKESAKITDCIMKRLRFDNETRNKVVELVSYHDATFEVGEKYVKRWLNKLGEKQFRRLLKVRKADIKGQKIFYDTERVEQIQLIEETLEDVLNKKECFSLRDLEIDGNDLINIGYKPGKEIGVVLKTLLDLVINGEIINKKEILLDIAERMK